MSPSDLFASPAAGQFSATSHPGTCASHDHVVQFYQNESALCATVSTFLADGVQASEPCVVIAASERVSAISERLLTRGVDLSAAVRTGLVIVQDADDLLSRFMIGEKPDPERFKSCISHTLRLAARTRPAVKLRVFGELVDLLCAQGRHGAALQVEVLWNDLAREHSFTLLCGYSVARFTAGRIPLDSKRSAGSMAALFMESPACVLHK